MPTATAPLATFDATAAALHAKYLKLQSEADQLDRRFIDATFAAEKPSTSEMTRLTADRLAKRQELALAQQDWEAIAELRSKASAADAEAIYSAAAVRRVQLAKDAADALSALATTTTALMAAQQRLEAIEQADLDASNEQTRVALPGRNVPPVLIGLGMTPGAAQGGPAFWADYLARDEATIATAVRERQP